MKRAVIYTRVSTENQDYSRQIEDLTKYSNEHNYELLKSFDEKVSGTLDASDRKQLTLLMNFVENTKVDIVLVWEISRLGRNTEDVLRTLRYFTERGINVYTKKENIFTLNEDGTKNTNTSLVLTMMAEISSVERETMLMRSRSGLERNSRMLGHWTGGILLPYGYTKNGKVLVIDEEEAEVVRNIFKWYLEGIENEEGALKQVGTGLIAEQLNKDKIKTRYNKAFKDKEKEVKTSGISKPADRFKFVDGTIYTILKNPIYAGRRRYLKTFIEKEEWRIISDEVFKCAQQKLKDTASKAGRKVTHFYLLENIKLNCGICGKTYYPYKRTNGNDNRYICLSKRYREDCGNVGIGIDKLANSIWHIAKNTGYVRTHIIKSASESDINKEIEQKELQLKNITKGSENIIKKERFILDLYMAGDLSEENFTERNKIIKNDRVKLNTQTDLLRGEIEQLKIYRDLQLDLNNQIRTIKGNKELMKKYLQDIVNKLIISKIKNDFKVGSIKGDENLLVELYLKSTPKPIVYVISQRSNAIVILNEGEYKDATVTGNYRDIKKRMKKIGWHSEN